MPRKQRVESSDGLYHVINRGNYRQAIFKTEGACESFEIALIEACERFGWRLHAYCLMTNHFHLCIATPLGNLSEGMRWLQSTYAHRFNKYRKERGHLFQGRFKSLIVEPGPHFLTLVNYIHLNPVRAGMVDVSDVAKYRWSSLFWFPKRKTRPKSLDARWMDYSDILLDTPGGWRKHLKELQMRVSDDPKEIERLERQMCRGWCIGQRSFKEALLEDFEQRGESICLERDELDELNRSIWASKLSKMLKALKKKDADIADDRFSADWKVAIASKLKRETSVTNAWLSEHLNMGAANGVSYLCGKYAREKEKSCPLARRLLKF